MDELISLCQSFLKCLPKYTGIPHYPMESIRAISEQIIRWYDTNKDGTDFSEAERDLISIIGKAIDDRKQSQDYETALLHIRSMEFWMNSNGHGIQPYKFSFSW